MANETGIFAAAIAEAAADDHDLARELHASFMASLVSQIDLLQRARCDANWRVSARRLGGLGASFHETGLARLAAEAHDGAPGDPVILRQILQYVGKFASPV